MKKYVFLIISILWTIVILSFSVQSGESSASLSYDITLFIYNGFKSINPNINFDVLHLVVRKCAHVGEYAILGILYMITGISFHLKRWIIISLGLVIALVDEGIQILSIERGPSFVDALLFDFPGFLIGVFITYAIYKIVHKI